MRFILSLIFLMLITSCSIFNSGTVHVKYTNARAEIDDVNYVNEEKIGNVSVSIRRVQHPKQHSKWDFNVGLSPSIHLDRQLFTPVNDQDAVDLTKTRFSMLGNLKFSFHTPAGAFVLTGGYGQSFFRLSKETGAESYRNAQIRKLDFAYIVFMSRRFYLLMGPRYYREKSDEFVFAFRLGYFWGQI